MYPSLDDIDPCPSPNEAVQVVHSSGRVTLATALKKLIDFRGSTHLGVGLRFPQREEIVSEDTRVRSSPKFAFG